MSPSRSTTRNRISLVSGAGSKNSPIGLIGAIALHLAVIALTLFTWEHRLDIVEESPPVVPVDLVTVAQKTNIAPTVERKIAPMPISQPPPPEPSIQTPQLPEQSEPAPLPQAKPRPVPKPQPPKKTIEQKFEEMVRGLAAETPQQHSKVSTKTQKGFGEMTAMTSDLENALRSQIYRCWSPPDYAPNPADLVVSYDLLLNPDGSVARSPQLDARSQAEKNRGNPYVTAADFAATKAIRECAPYKLPADRYSQWREINPFKFDPRDMTGQ